MLPTSRSTTLSNSLSNTPDPQDPSPFTYWIYMPRYGTIGRAIGFAAVTLAGVLGGALGTIFVFLLGYAAQAGILGQPEPGILGPVFSGGWFAGLFGILPGLIMGLAVASSNNTKVILSAYVVGILLGCGSFLAYGYPTTLSGACTYIGGPFLAPVGAGFLSRRVKARLGLVPEAEARFIVESQDRQIEKYEPD